jgi:hypothetical protein
MGWEPDTGDDASMKNVPEMKMKVFEGEEGSTVNLADLRPI